MEHKTILYLGNKLERKGGTPTGIDTLSKLLEREYQVITRSDKLNMTIRLMEMLLSIVTNRKKLSVVLIDTYSNKSFYYAYLSGLLCRFFRIPYVPILRGGQLHGRYRRTPGLVRFLFGHATRVVAPSNYLKKQFEDSGFEVITIPNNIEIREYPFKKRTVFRPRLLYVRAFHEIYNPTLAIRVLQKVRERYPEAELCMVGPDKDGSLQQCLDLARELGVADSLKVTGRLGKKEWHRLSEEYDIFINTTNFDNTPVSVIESMALGLGLVSTNVWGIPYLVENQVEGLLVPPDNTQAMVQAVFQLIEEPELGIRLTGAARDKVEQFDWEVVRRQWKQVIEGS